MGMVYKARDRALEETVALKVLRSDVADDPTWRAASAPRSGWRARSATATSAASTSTARRAACATSPWSTSRAWTCARILSERARCPPDEAFEACIHVAEGLQAIHEAGIIHRDLKTANIMRDGAGRGPAHGLRHRQAVRGRGRAGGHRHRADRGHARVHEPRAGARREVDSRSDVYALGIVVFELFTGRVPFRGETPIATIFKHLQEPAAARRPRGGRVAPGAIPVLRRALAKKPEERHGSAMEFAHDMVEARDAAGIAPPAAGPITPRPSRPLSATATTLSPPIPTISHAPTSTRGPTTRRPRSWIDREPARLPRHAGPGPRGDRGGCRRRGAGRRRRVDAKPRHAARHRAGVASATAAEQRGRGSRGQRHARDRRPPLGRGDGGAAGRRHAPAMDGLAVTPLALELPPGDYTVRVRNPGFAQPLSVTATVKPRHRWSGASSSFAGWTPPTTSGGPGARWHARPRAAPPPCCSAWPSSRPPRAPITRRPIGRPSKPSTASVGPRSRGSCARPSPRTPGRASGSSSTACASRPTSLTSTWAWPC